MRHRTDFDWTSRHQPKFLQTWRLVSDFTLEKTPVQKYFCLPSNLPILPSKQRLTEKVNSKISSQDSTLSQVLQLRNLEASWFYSLSNVKPPDLTILLSWILTNLRSQGLVVSKSCHLSVSRTSTLIELVLGPSWRKRPELIFQVFEGKGRKTEMNQSCNQIPSPLNFWCIQRF